MTYWLVMTTLFWSHTYGNYTKAECLDAASQARGWYMTVQCVPQPTPSPEHQH